MKRSELLARFVKGYHKGILIGWTEGNWESAESIIKNNGENHLICLLSNRIENNRYDLIAVQLEEI